MAICSILFLIFQIIYYTTSKKGLDSVPIGIETILVFIYLFYYLYEQFNSQKYTFIYENYSFWIALGILVALGVSFFINILANDLDRHIIDNYWYITYISDFIKNILFSISILIYVRYSKNGKPNKHTIPNLDF